MSANNGPHLFKDAIEQAFGGELLKEGADAADLINPAQLLAEAAVRHALE